METNKEKKILGYKQPKVKHTQATYFLIGLVGAIVFMCLLTMVILVNNLVTPFIPQFVLISLTFLVGFAVMDAVMMAILLQYHYGKY